MEQIVSPMFDGLNNNIEFNVIGRAIFSPGIFSLKKARRLPLWLRIALMPTLDAYAMNAFEASGVHTNWCLNAAGDWRHQSAKLWYKTSVE